MQYLRHFKLQTSHLQLILLLVWIGVGTALRFTNLTAKPPWTDEFATLVYSLGNNYQNVPLDKAIAIDVLLQPLQPNPAMGIGDVIHKLFAEDVHPPVYFVLAHLWMQMFPPQGGLISVWGARSLPAFFGVASIPAVYWLSRAAFRSPLAGQLAAAMMAVSPYSIFLAQEARHYTLAVLWVIASLSCLLVAARHLQAGSLPLWLGLTWVGINTLGIATHYFISLTLCAEALALIAVGNWSTIRGKKKKEVQRTEEEETNSQEGALPLQLNTQNWLRLVAVAAGTTIGSLVWLPHWLHHYNAPNTAWIKNSSGSLLEWINPVFQILAAWLTMMCLLPVESPFIAVVIASGFVMIVFFVWVLPILRRGLIALWEQSPTRLATRLFGGFVLGAIAQFFGMKYIIGIDITRGARYNFLYFPAVIVLLGAILATIWNVPEIKSPFLRTSGKKAVVAIWLIGLMSGVTVVCNLGYQKYYRPDLFVPAIQQTSYNVPVLIATAHKTLVQTGEMMGLGLEFKRHNSQVNPQFLLAHQDKDPKTSTIALKQTLDRLPRPLDLWLVNFDAPIEVGNCLLDSKFLSSVNGYGYKLYHCNK